MDKEKLYNEFVANILPQIQEGLTVTKGYFLDLFGRYAKFLLIVDALWLAVWIVAFVGGIVFLRLSWEKMVSRYQAYINDDSNYETEDPELAELVNLVSLVISLLAIVLGMIGIPIQASDVIKDIYIPEVRVYQSLSNLNYHYGE